MRQDSVDHGGVLDRRQHDHAAPAPGTREDVGFERPAHEVGPGAIPRARAVSLRVLTLVIGGRRGWARLDSAGLGLGARHHLPAPRGVRRQDAVKEDQVDSRPWHQRHEPLHELHGREDEMGRPVRPRPLQGDGDPPVAEPAQASLSERRPAETGRAARAARDRPRRRARRHGGRSRRRGRGAARGARPTARPGRRRRARDPGPRDGRMPQGPRRFTCSVTKRPVTRRRHRGPQLRIVSASLARVSARELERLGRARERRTTENQHGVTAYRRVTRVSTASASPRRRRPAPPGEARRR